MDRQGALTAALCSEHTRLVRPAFFESINRHPGGLERLDFSTSEPARDLQERENDPMNGKSNDCSPGKVARVVTLFSPSICTGFQSIIAPFVQPCSLQCSDNST